MMDRLIAGIMSGTSLDGLDIAICGFSESDLGLEYVIHYAETIEYPKSIKQALVNAPKMSSMELSKLHADYGKFIGNNILKIKNKLKIGGRIEFIASHGHTVFHQPEAGFTLQIGSAADIAAITGLTVVADFRSLDVALGGQGAPLVPIGDKLLFSDYDVCVNLGGFSNCSFDNAENKRVAFDICPVNIVLNYYAEKLGLAFDDNGNIGSKGILNEALLKDLNNIEYYKLPYPKSLGREWLKQVFMLVINSYSLSIEDTVRTLYEHIAMQIANSLPKEGSALFTGGGVHNGFLMQRIKDMSKLKITIPEKELIDYKEALIFALLAWLRLQNRINVLSSVTGAKRDHSGGMIFYP